MMADYRAPLWTALPCRSCWATSAAANRCHRRLQGGPADAIAGRFREACRVVRPAFCLVCLDHPILQYYQQHGSADPQRAAVICSVRAGGHWRTRPGQDRSLTPSLPSKACCINLTNSQHSRRMLATPSFWPLPRRASGSTILHPAARGHWRKSHEAKERSRGTFAFWRRSGSCRPVSCPQLLTVLSVRMLQSRRSRAQCRGRGNFRPDGLGC
jgi:hypothetical protein